MGQHALAHPGDTIRPTHAVIAGGRRVALRATEDGYVMDPDDRPTMPALVVGFVFDLTAEHTRDTVTLTAPPVARRKAGR